MALIKCQECGTLISDKAVSCPKCGNQIVSQWKGFEWKSEIEVLGFPLIHIAVGRDKKTGKLLIAKGIIAIGQFATGITAIGQFAFGQYVLAQMGYGKYVWSVKTQDPQAIGYFKHLLSSLRGFIK